MKFLLLIIFCFTLVLFSCNNYEQSDLLKRDLPVDSIAVKEKLLETDSLNLPLREELAVIYYNKNNLDKAIYHFIKLCQKDTDNTVALITLGNIYYDSRQFSNAVDYYEKALKYDSLNTNIRCDLATCYLNINNPEKALELLKTNLTIDNNHVQSHYNLSIVYNILGKNKESVKESDIYKKITKTKIN